MTSTFVSLLCLLLAVNDVTSQRNKVEAGFERLYSSSPDELVNVPMKFSAGKVPDWVNGTLVRIGPGLFELDKSYVTNSLDGLAKLAKWKFVGNNNILFSTKFLRTIYYTESVASKKFKSNIFVSAPVPALTEAELERSKEVGIDNMDINIVDFPDKTNKTVNYVATNDIWSVYEFSLDDLSTVRKVTPAIAGASEPLPQESPEFLKHLSTAHPLPEPNTDNRINILIQAALPPSETNIVKVIRMNSLNQTVEVIASLEIKEVSLLHSFSVTQTKVIFLTNKYILNVTCMAENSGNCYSYKTGNESVTMYVVDLNTGNVRSFEVPPIFIYHHINANDVNNDKLILDVAAYNSAVIFEKFDLKKVRNVLKRKQIQPQADMKRISVTFSTNTVTITSIPSPSPTSLIASTLDYPVINEVNRSKPYCYVYGIVEKLDGKNLASMGVAKKDVCTDDGIHADALFTRIGWYPSEPTFVPNPNPSAEDDGLLLVPYTVGQDKKTNLVVLNARDLSFIDVAVGPNIIPQSQHGHYYDV